jgi:hypothetical protein
VDTVNGSLVALPHPLPLCRMNNRSFSFSIQTQGQKEQDMTQEDTAVLFMT